MTRTQTGDVVRLATSDKLQILGLVLACLVPIAGVGIGMFARLAVVETKVEDLRAEVGIIRSAQKNLAKEPNQ